MTKWAEYNSIPINFISNKGTRDAILNKIIEETTPTNRVFQMLKNEGLRQREIENLKVFEGMNDKDFILKVLSIMDDLKHAKNDLEYLGKQLKKYTRIKEIMNDETESEE